MCPLEWAKWCPDSWWNTFWRCLWRCLWKRWAFDLVDRVKNLYQCVWASSNLLGAWIEQKGWGRAYSVSLLELRQPSSPVPDIGVPGSQASDSEVIPPALLGLQLTDGRSWSFLASKVMWANSYNKSESICLSIDLCIYLSNWFYFSGESWLTQTYSVLFPVYYFKDISKLY